jgi:hypothetical protein
MRCAWSRAANCATASCTVLVFLVLQFQRDDRQAVEEDDEVDLLPRLAKVEVRTKGEAVLAVSVRCGALDRAGFG